MHPGRGPVHAAWASHKPAGCRPMPRTGIRASAASSQTRTRHQRPSSNGRRADRQRRCTLEHAAPSMAHAASTHTWAKRSRAHAGACACRGVESECRSDGGPCGGGGAGSHCRRSAVLTRRAVTGVRARSGAPARRKELSAGCVRGAARRPARCGCMACYSVRLARKRRAFCWPCTSGCLATSQIRLRGMLPKKSPGKVEQPHMLRGMLS